MGLTEKQEAFLAYLSGYLEEQGHAPSFQEICDRFGFASFNTVTSYLRALERKGYVRLPRQKNLKRAIQVVQPGEDRSFEFPLLGTVAAGRPIEALEDPQTVEVPPSMAGEGECFVLRVQGDSMEEEGILDGDLVVVRKQPFAENGEIVVALLHNEATVKKYYRRPDHVELRPAHRGMSSFRVQEEDFRIEGKVVGVMRYYR